MKLIKALWLTLWLTARYAREINGVLRIGDLKHFGLEGSGVEVWVQSTSGLCVEFHSGRGFCLQSHSVQFSSEQALSELKSLSLGEWPVEAHDPEIVPLLEIVTGS
jgi:hypothetical protein